jgi:hypothetical protein
MTAETAVASPRSVWYRRRGWLVAIAVLAVVAIAVLTDLPQPASRGVQISGDASIVRQMNADVRGCSYGLSREVFPIYEDELRHDLAPGQRALVPGLLHDDQAACSFTNQDIYDLSSIEVPSTPSGRYLQHLVGTVTTWVTSDALSAIEAIQKLWVSPHDPAALRELATAVRELGTDRAVALGDVRAADRLLGARLPPPDVPAVPAALAARQG